MAFTLAFTTDALFSFRLADFLFAATRRTVLPASLRLLLRFLFRAHARAVHPLHEGRARANRRTSLRTRIQRRAVAHQTRIHVRHSHLSHPLPREFLYHCALSLSLWCCLDRSLSLYLPPSLANALATRRTLCGAAGIPLAREGEGALLRRHGRGEGKVEGKGSTWVVMHRDD